MNTFSLRQTKRTVEVYLKIFHESGAIWAHDSNPNRPHIIIGTSGQHTDTYFKSEYITRDSYLLDEICSDLVVLLKREGVNLVFVDMVVGIAMGSITLADGIARHMTLERDSEHTDHCLTAYVEKIGEGKDKRVRFNKTTIRMGMRTLICDDVITTGSSVVSTEDTVIKNGGNALPYILCLVNRSGLTNIGGKKILSLVDYPMSSWSPELCPLCKRGSKALRPEEGNNWSYLNRIYME